MIAHGGRSATGDRVRMPALPVVPQIEVLDLRHFSSRQLRPLLELEAELWRTRLHWDYRSSTELLLQYLESRILQGFVALDRGRVCGYTFCVYEGTKAVIGDAFASTASRAPDPATTRLLLTHVIEMLRNSPAVDRVESQLLLFDAGEFVDLFRGPEFTVYPRLFLELNLGKVSSNAAVPPELDLSPWAAQDYQSAAELIHACYQGHTDARINDQYRSLHGSLRFLHNIVRFPGCGVFEPSYSWILRDRVSRAMLGMVLVSRVGDRVGHITQICISPAQRNRGLGKLLLTRCASALRTAGFEAVTLTVTESNADAVRLYDRFGFTAIHRFDAMVLETRHRR
jgi:ribosomal protein S18 acetylase RimI-like enzyme